MYGRAGVLLHVPVGFVCVYAILLLCFSYTFFISVFMSTCHVRFNILCLLVYQFYLIKFSFMNYDLQYWHWAAASAAGHQVL